MPGVWPEANSLTHFAIVFDFLKNAFNFVLGFPGGSAVKNLPANAVDFRLILGLERQMATHSSILAWEIQWTEESIAGHSPRGHKRVRRDLANKQQFLLGCSLFLP